jgi:hypothetical protein
MQPYIKFKQTQVKHALAMLETLEGKSFPSLSRKTRADIADKMIAIRAANYKTRPHKHSPEAIKALLTF